ncbi:MAG: hypothetical protein M3522_13615 [Actinomycetota bacterium]|nr:hypothetical protein [Actinomycetota bacterium]
MGEDRLTGDASPSNHRLTVPQAAARLDMTEAAVRGRIKRRTLRSERESGTVYVLLEGDEPTINRDDPPSEPSDQYDRVEDLLEQVAYLREQLDREREARTEERRRHDTIIAQLSAATAEQARTIRAIEAPASEEPTQDAETVEEEPEGAEPRSATGGAQETTPRRPWWRRMFGG